ncbi:hypothetical protein BSL78_13194 [Apostichopus japonicus]|uniref:Uncharacterized protein n=1 Tax=Stichopus japonicus TaxID=307972 RepID=A0A2G8KPI7_STIJA|nr:hypothetical protein BSL78_13194 [Apostichopus japonicus]
MEATKESEVLLFNYASGCMRDDECSMRKGSNGDCKLTDLIYKVLIVSLPVNCMTCCNEDDFCNAFIPGLPLPKQSTAAPFTTGQEEHMQTTTEQLQPTTSLEEQIQTTSSQEEHIETTISPGEHIETTTSQEELIHMSTSPVEHITTTTSQEDNIMTTMSQHMQTVTSPVEHIKTTTSHEELIKTTTSQENNIMKTTSQLNHMQTATPSIEHIKTSMSHEELIKTTTSQEDNIMTTMSQHMQTATSPVEHIKTTTSHEELIKTTTSQENNIVKTTSQLNHMQTATSSIETIMTNTSQEEHLPMAKLATTTSSPYYNSSSDLFSTIEVHSTGKSFVRLPMTSMQDNRWVEESSLWPVSTEKDVTALVDISSETTNTHTGTHRTPTQDPEARPSSVPPHNVTGRLISFHTDKLENYIGLIVTRVSKVFVKAFYNHLLNPINVRSLRFTVM